MPRTSCQTSPASAGSDGLSRICSYFQPGQLILLDVFTRALSNQLQSILRASVCKYSFCVSVLSKSHLFSKLQFLPVLKNDHQFCLHLHSVLQCVAAVLNNYLRQGGFRSCEVCLLSVC